MKKALSILLLIGTALSFAACQVTPEAPIIVEKDTERMVEKAQQTLPPELEVLPLTKRYSIKEHLDKEVSLFEGKLIIRVDADVVVPAVDTLSITHVVPANFTQETVSALFEALCGSTVMYKGRNEFSKPEIEQLLLTLKRQKEELVANGGESWEIENLDSAVAYYETQYAAAPDAIEDSVCDGTLYPGESWIKDVFIGTYTYVLASEFPGPQDFLWYTGKKCKTFYVFNNSDQTEPVDTGSEKMYPSRQANMEYHDERYYDSSWDCYWNSKRLSVASSADLTQGELDAAGLSPESAIAQAEALFARVRIPFTVQDVRYIAAKAPFYELDCSRQVNGANLTIGGEGVGGDGLSPYWPYERLRIWISGNGIFYFFWISPYEVADTEVENATLLPFEQIEEIFYGMMKAVYAPQAQNENGTGIRVTKVSLQLQRLKLKEDNSEGLLTPVWCFYGTRTVDEAVKNEGMTSDWERGYMPLLIVNAIDGSIIDLEKGY
ncbi:MAG TPA: DUF6034 family protein [Clostridia bacterium]|nr:DUF6034 family protein [Clostridia bacterium]HPK16558.1 DUF6034 family protein [Clostridia bacterium]